MRVEEIKMNEKPTNIEKLIKWMTPKKKKPNEKPGILDLLITLSRNGKGVAVIIAGILCGYLLFLTNGAHGIGL